MYTRLILLSKLFILLSIAPAWAQYSFEKVLGGDGNERPYGMMKLSNGTLVVYGISNSQNVAGNNYVACLNKAGELLWERQSTSRWGYGNYSSHETKEGNILLTGDSEYKGGSPYLALLDPNGNILFDTSIALRSTSEGGGIFKAIYDDEKQEIVSIGGGGIYNKSGILFHRCTYSGKQGAYKITLFENTNSPITSFHKVKDKDEYLVYFGPKFVRLDSVGNVIANFEWAVDLNGGSVDFHDMVQNEDGTFTCLVYNNTQNIGGYYLQLNDRNGKFVKYLTRFTVYSRTHFYNTITRTKDKGFFIAGIYITLIDSNGQVVWQKNTGRKDYNIIVATGESLDGGFYGCAEDYNGSEDIYVFKTTVDGEIRTGIKETANNLKAQVMPNPSNGLFTISGEFIQAQVSVSNLLGQEIMKTSLLSGEKLDASQLNPGLYLLTITSGKASVMQRICISR